MELLDIVDENGIPTGETVEREVAHRNGVPHRTSHVWIVRKKAERIEILLQKRCANKDSFPGCYDISSAGHIPTGMGFVDSALRELKEELGVDAIPEELIDCGTKHLIIKTQFREMPYEDNQISKVFLLWKDMEIREFVVQKEEIDSVVWIEFKACKEAVMKKEIPNCIDIEELEMLEAHLS